MHFARFFVVLAGAGIVTSMTDWFFAGDWIHKRFTYPEIWRKEPETRAIVVSSVLPFVTCVAFLVLAWWIGVPSLGAALKLAVLVWLIGPLPLILTNAAFIKFHRVFVILYLIGWLVKLLLVGVAAHWLLV